VGATNADGPAADNQNLCLMFHTLSISHLISI